MNGMRRRDLLAIAAQLPVLAGLGALVAACGGGSMSYGGSSSSGGGGTTSCDGITPTMDLHFHPTCLTMAELNGGKTVTLTMMAGSGAAAGHTHQVTVPMTDLSTLLAAGTAVETSTTTGHSHQVTFKG